MPFEFKLTVTVSGIDTEAEAVKLCTRAHGIMHDALSDSPHLPAVVSDNLSLSTEHIVEYIDTPVGDLYDDIIHVAYPDNFTPAELKAENEGRFDRLRWAAARRKEMTTSGKRDVHPDTALVELLRKTIDEAYREEGSDRNSTVKHLDDTE